MAANGGRQGQSNPAVPKHSHHPAKADPSVTLRARRDAALRLAPLGDGHADPFDEYAWHPIGKPIYWPDYDVRHLGLAPHNHDTCRYCQAVGE